MHSLRVHWQVTLEITSKDRAYPWVLAWLTRQASLGRQFGSASTLAQHVSVTTSTKGSGVDSSGGDSSGDVSAGQSSGDIRFDFAPCPGRHFVGYKGRLLRVRNRLTSYSSAKELAHVYSFRGCELFHSIQKLTTRSTTLCYPSFYRGAHIPVVFLPGLA